jgi:hypothetical protein
MLLIGAASTPSRADEYKLIGSSLLEVTMFKLDVYKIKYYEKNKTEQKLTLKYLRDVEKKYSVMGWEQSLEKIKDKNLKSAKEWLVNTSSDIKENDLIEIYKDSNSVIFKKNGVQTHKSKNPNIIQLVLEPWIGRYPITKEIKNELLGGK